MGLCLRSVMTSSFEKLTSKLKIYQLPTAANVCMCQALQTFLFLSRLIGILPVSVSRKNKHFDGCMFEARKPWLYYSMILQVIFFIYMWVVYVYRFYVGPPDHSDSEWFVLTFGYMLHDLEAFITISAGYVFAHDVCANLHKLSIVPGMINETRSLQKYLRFAMATVFLLSLFRVCSYAYVSFLIYETQLYSFVLDNPTVNLFRGFMIIYSLHQIAVSFMFSYLICSKYQHLAALTAKCLNRFSMNKVILTTMEVSIVEMSDPENMENSKLGQLEVTFRRITECVETFNKCVGLQIFISISTSIYLTIYFLYRWSTSTERSLTNNTHERFHYLIGIFFRSGKILSYMLMGKRLLESSQLPLKVLQDSDIINLPTRIQSKVQTLILQWFGRKTYLSAYGVVNVGPWLLAPIAGNVITYLLVAIQFEQHDVDSSTSNSTSRS